MRRVAWMRSLPIISAADSESRRWRPTRERRVVLVARHAADLERAVADVEHALRRGDLEVVDADRVAVGREAVTAGGAQRGRTRRARVDDARGARTGASRARRDASRSAAPNPDGSAPGRARRRRRGRRRRSRCRARRATRGCASTAPSSATARSANGIAEACSAGQTARMRKPGLQVPRMPSASHSDVRSSVACEPRTSTITWSDSPASGDRRAVIRKSSVWAPYESVGPDFSSRISSPSRSTAAMRPAEVAADADLGGHGGDQHGLRLTIAARYVRKKSSLAQPSTRQPDLDLVHREHHSRGRAGARELEARGGDVGERQLGTAERRGHQRGERPAGAQRVDRLLREAAVSIDTDCVLGGHGGGGPDALGERRLRDARAHAACPSVIVADRPRDRRDALEGVASQQLVGELEVELVLERQHQADRRVGGQPRLEEVVVVVERRRRRPPGGRARPGSRGCVPARSCRETFTVRGLHDRRGGRRRETTGVRDAHGDVADARRRGVAGDVAGELDLWGTGRVARDDDVRPRERVARDPAGAP